MDLKIDPAASLAELQLTLFMAAITALIELAKTTDKDHIKLRALTEVARLCNPAKPASPKPLPPSPHGTRSASDGPQALAASQATSSPHTPIPVACARGSEGIKTSPPRHTGAGSAKPVSPSPAENLPLESLLPLNRRQRRFIARMETKERKRATPCAA